MERRERQCVSAAWAMEIGSREIDAPCLNDKIYGSPTINATETARGVHHQYVYPTSTRWVTIYLYFDNGILTSKQKY